MKRRNITKQGRAAAVVTTMRLRDDGKWKRYEQGKSRLQLLNLSPEEYEKAVQALTRALGV